MARVAFLGLGVMGFPMAGHIAGKGHEVTVYNRTAKKAADWVAKHGGKSAATPAQAAEGQEFVFSCVGNDDDLRSVTLGKDGAFAAMAKGSVFIDNTTASANVARELDAAARKGGFGFLDAPVSGGQAGAENGALTVMVGGDEATFDKAKPVIESYARMVGLMGPAGAGQLTKMVNQISIAGLVEGLAEAHPLCPECRPRCRKSHRRHLQGRGRLLADGKPPQDDERRQIRFRLRRRMDAQGPRHVPRRGAAQRLAPAGRRARRPILRRNRRRWAASAGILRACWRG